MKKWITLTALVLGLGFSAGLAGWQAQKTAAQPAQTVVNKHAEAKRLANSTAPSEGTTTKDTQKPEAATQGQRTADQWQHCDGWATTANGQTQGRAARGDGGYCDDGQGHQGGHWADRDTAAQAQNDNWQGHRQGHRGNMMGHRGGNWHNNQN